MILNGDSKAGITSRFYSSAFPVLMNSDEGCSQRGMTVHENNMFGGMQESSAVIDTLVA